ncbi:MAG: DNA polymerase III subunit gamma/tau [Halioglobus sp.]
MSYQVLARKWRPKRFREMVGQEHVLQALINALDHDRLHHAYLFTGTRGVGKTTIARILAKCLNCEAGVSSEPCGTCSSCLEIAEGRSVDLIEVDAASRTKVEDTRELLENVQYAPTRSRYKVYLIDEVHMLSGHSFNALLKTLEEPPPHVKFLLATTDPQKLPATILSRCLQFNLKNMPPQQIVSHLTHVLTDESISFEEPALWLLGRAAAGSMRDALSLTDQAISFGSGKLGETDVRSMLGTVDLNFVYQMLEQVAAGQGSELLATVAKMSEHAPDFDSGLDELIALLHRLAVAQVVPDAIDNSWGDAQRIADLAASITAEDVQLFYQMALNGKRDVALASDPRSGLEMVLLRMLAFRPQVVFEPQAGGGDGPAVGSLPDAATVGAGRTAKKQTEPLPAAGASLARPEATKPDTAPKLGAEVPSKLASTERPSTVGPATEVPHSVAPVRQSQGVEPPERATPQKPEPRLIPEGEDASLQGQAAQLGSLSPETWADSLQAAGLVGIVYTIASNCELRARDGDELTMILDPDNAALFNDSHITKIRLALENYYGQSLQVSITPGELQRETPAMIELRRKGERQQEAEQSIYSDAMLQQLIDRFDGTVDPASITPTDT